MTNQRPEISAVKMPTIHDAVREQRLDMIEQLLGWIAPVDCRDDKDRTPLHIAAEEGNGAIVRLLLDRGANVDASDSDEYTPLHIAARYDHVQVALLLLDNDANIDAKNNLGFTPLREAIFYGRNKVVELLTSRNADVNADPWGRGLLDYAVYHLEEKICHFYDYDCYYNGKPPNNVLAQQDLFRCITKHVIKLYVAGLYLSRDNIHEVEEQIKRNYSDYSVHLACRKELETIRDRKLNKQATKQITLYDALIKCTVPRFSEESIKFLETIDYADFPLYGNLMKTNLNNIKRRRELISSAKESFHALNKRIRLPSEILEKIFGELENRDLRNLVSCCSAK